jgi:uncharacterized protein
MKLGIISDTHNHFDPQIPKLFAGVEHILHGGDIGQPRILLQLEQIASVTAVCGNTDDPGFGYRLTETVELSDKKFLVHHIVKPHALHESLERRIQNERPAVVVFGHTHKPFCETLAGILFLNPGYAGQNRFNLERSVAILHLENGQFRSEYFKL